MVSFNYRQFSGDTTILTIQLRDLLQATAITEMPVIVQGRQGSQNVPVRIAALVDSLTDGSYQLDFILDGNPIAHYSFSSMISLQQ